MKVFEFESIAESYPELIRYVYENGDEVSPRGMLTKEISPATVVIKNPRKRVIDDKIRKLNYGFMAGELLWILQGKNDLSITHYNKQWAKFSDDGEILNGAYGQRIFDWDGGESFIPSQENSSSYELIKHNINQFNEVYNRLKNDVDSRQGTIVLFDPTKDFANTKDVPCTNLMRFSIRNGKLNMLVVMRSNDLWLGYPYDVYNFTMLQEIMAGMLNVEVGKYTHVVDSLHLYEMHFEKAEQLINTPKEHVYDKFETLDSRVDNDFNFGDIFYVEHITRENGEDVSLDDTIEAINKIENDYWKSIAALIAHYNFKKYKRDKIEIDKLKSLIVNEFQYLI